MTPALRERVMLGPSTVLQVIILCGFPKPRTCLHQQNYLKTYIYKFQELLTGV